MGRIALAGYIRSGTQGDVSLLAERKLTAKAEFNFEICKSNLKKMLEKKSQFVINWNRILLQLKITVRKLSIEVNTGGPSIRLLNERRVSDGGEEK